MEGSVPSIEKNLASFDEKRANLPTQTRKRTSFVDMPFLYEELSFDEKEEGIQIETKTPGAIIYVIEEEAEDEFILEKGIHFRIGKYVFNFYFEKDNTVVIKLLQNGNSYTVKADAKNTIGSHPLNNIFLYDKLIPGLAAIISANFQGKFVLRNVGNMKCERVKLIDRLFINNGQSKKLYDRNGNIVTITPE
eukprot:TRINITY_DN10125_c0_g1_i4.p1 TRINITY_DN10125_c0_g1~~TRINITY_DN10125_c0_g1_i4.p1  ORF type:complete len:192 (-),score=23.53 TRINITY_DN10125_c0_g1_i4:130-705(-)